MLNTEFDFYLAHQDELVKKYLNKHIVIVGSEVVGAYNSKSEAYVEAAKKFELGKFFIQHCTPGDSSYTQTFHSRVTFQ